MSKTNVKSLHALIDELADAGKGEMLTALHVILMNAASGAADDEDLSNGDLDLDLDGGSSKKGGKRKVRGKAKAEADDEEDDNGDDADDDNGDDDDDLGSLDLDSEEDEDDKPARGRRGRGKAAKEEKPARGRRRGRVAEPEEEEEDDEADADDEAGDAPTLDDASEFQAFLDAVDEYDGIEEVAGGVRELQARLQGDYDFDVATLDLGNTKKMSTKEVREAKQAAMAITLGRFDFIRDALVEGGAELIEAVAEEEDVDLEGATGRGKKLLVSQAQLIVAAFYGPEDDEDGEDDE